MPGSSVPPAVSCQYVGLGKEFDGAVSTNSPVSQQAVQNASALSLATLLTTHWEAHGLFRAGRETLTSALDAGGGTTLERAAAHGAVGTLAMAQGDLDGARDAHQTAITPAKGVKLRENPRPKLAVIIH